MIDEEVVLSEVLISKPEQKMLLAVLVCGVVIMATVLLEFELSVRLKSQG